MTHEWVLNVGDIYDDSVSNSDPKLYLVLDKGERWIVVENLETGELEVLQTDGYRLEERKAQKKLNASRAKGMLWRFERVRNEKQEELDQAQRVVDKLKEVEPNSVVWNVD